MYNNYNNSNESYKEYVSIDNNVLTYDNDIVSIPSNIRSLTLTEHTEDVNECTDDQLLIILS